MVMELATVLFGTVAGFTSESVVLLVRGHPVVFAGCVVAIFVCVQLLCIYTVNYVYAVMRMARSVLGQRKTARVPFCSRMCVCVGPPDGKPAESMRGPGETRVCSVCKMQK